MVLVVVGRGSTLVRGDPSKLLDKDSGGWEWDSGVGASEGDSGVKRKNLAVD